MRCLPSGSAQYSIIVSLPIRASALGFSYKLLLLRPVVSSEQDALRAQAVLVLRIEFVAVERACWIERGLFWGQWEKVPCSADPSRKAGLVILHGWWPIAGN